MTSRRTFLRQGAMLATAAFAFPTIGFARTKKYKLGLQLYTMRDAMAKDVRQTLQRASAMGYEEVEIYGFQDSKYYGMTPASFKKILDDNNLTTSSGHYDLNKFMLPGSTIDDLKKYVDQCIDGALELRQDYITWPWLDPSSRTIEKFHEVAEKLNIIGTQINNAGLQLAYHNHDFEFIEHNGKIGYDIILNETDASLVKLQMDLYWVSHSSKLKPHDWFAKHPGRFVMWHIKDMDKVNRDLHTEVGNGTIDFKKIFEDASIAGVQHIFVEQGNNLMADPFQSISNSAEYVKHNLIR